MSDYNKYYAVSLIEGWGLTKRKRYTILDETGLLIKIKDDMLKVCWYEKKDFTLVEEHNTKREHKAPKIKNKQKGIK